MKEWIYGGLAAAALGLGLWALMPQPTELTEVRIRAAGIEEAVVLLEQEHVRRPEDPAITRRLVTAYERAQRPQNALSVLRERASEARLTPDERAQAKRLALAAGKPAEALAILTGPRQVLGVAERQEAIALALAANQPKLALAHQQALVSEQPGDEGALEKLRELALAAGNGAEAIRAQRSLVALETTSERLEGLIRLQLAANDPAGALDTHEKHPPPGDRTRWHRRAAELAGWARQPGRAVPHLEALYQAAPDRTLGLELARALETARSARATAFAEALARRHPGDAALRDHLLGRYLRERRPAAALAWLKAEAVARPEDAAAHRRLVDFQLGQGDRAGAIAELERWLAGHGADREARHQLAVVQVWDGRPEAGWDTYASLLADAPRSGPMGDLERKWRSEWLKISRAVEDATPSGLANLERLVAADPDNAPLRRRLALGALEAGEPAVALAHQKRLVAHVEATGQDALRLAEWQLWYGETPAAVALLEKLDDRAPLPAAVLKDAIDRCGQARRFADAARLLERLSRRAPKDAALLDELAAARQAAGDAPGAIAAWQRRLALGAADPGRRSMAYALMLKQNRQAEVLAAIGKLSDATAAEWRLAAAIASRLGRAADERRALSALQRLQPKDVEVPLAFAALAEREHDFEAAERHYDAALALAPGDAGLLTRVAASRLYGKAPEQAAPLIPRLEALEKSTAETLRVLADFHQARDAGKAAAALDALHRLGEGDAETYFRRGELAASRQDGAIAQESYQEAARRGLASSRLEDQEAGAYALERLGRGPEAEHVWERLASATPPRLSAILSLARARAARGELAAAERQLQAAEALAPGRTEVRLARAEWLRAAGRDAEAAEALAALSEEEPANRYLAAAEAMARHGAGQYGRAHAVAKRAWRETPFDADLQAAYRVAREKGASRVGFTAFQERYSGLERSRMGATSQSRLGDRLRLQADLQHLEWAGGGLKAQELALGLRHEAAKGVELEAQLAVSGQLAAGAVQSPLGSLAVSAERAGLSGRVAIAETRWEETNAVALQGGRERKLSLEGGWQPDPRLGVRAGADLGQLVLAGRTLGPAGLGMVEVALRPEAESRWGAYYQLRHRVWGTAGPPLGLPEQLTIHRAVVGYADRLGPLRVECQPGVVADPTVGAVAPTVSGELALEFSPAQELRLSGAWSGRSFAVGQEGTYQNVSLAGTWWF